MTVSVIDLDDTDRAILRALAGDGTLSAGELGRRLGLSQPAAWRRVRRLEEAGVLKGLAVEVDREKLGFGVTVFLGVKLATKGRVSLEDFERAVTAIPEVQVVQHVLGLFDYRIKVRARDIAVPPGRISGIVNGKRGITADTALRLGKYFGVSPQTWMGLQAEYDLRIARRLLGAELDKRVHQFAA